MRLKEILAERKKAAARVTTPQIRDISDDQAKVADQNTWNCIEPMSEFMALFEGCTDF